MIDVKNRELSGAYFVKRYMKITFENYVRHLVSYLVAALIMIEITASAQEIDRGLWLNPSVVYKGLKKVDLELSPELRWDQDLTRLRTRQVDLKARYDLKRGYFAGMSLRLGAIQRNSGWQPRQRIQFNGGKKWKPGDFRIGYTTKIQFTLSGQTRTRDADLNSSFRNKLSLNYVRIKKFTPCVSYELFHGLSEEAFLQFQDWRFILEGEYKINKRNSIGLGYLLQQQIRTGIDQRDKVILINYQHTIP
ncbi:MAG: DUF2490 domain-containing protein [Bacteroidota bacterium]|jgi:hypothetical protein